LERVEIKRNYAFIEFRNVEDAIDAQRRAHTATFNGRTITVEFTQGDGDKRGGDRDR
jgi:RNA recognition motif-containing protein